jgi:gas vesicle protein
MAISNKKMLGALLVAAAVGATVGLLVAPGKGKDTRKKLARKAEDAKNKFTDLVDELKCEYEELKEKAKEYSGRT